MLGLAAFAWPLIARAANAPTRIVMLGDSITAGYGLPAEEALPARLEAALKADGYNVVVLNHGVSGDTMADGLARLSWALKDKPDLMIVALGANDMLRGTDPAETRRDLETILSRLDKAHVPALVAGMKAERNMGPEYVEKFEPIFPELAAEHHDPLYPFLLDQVALDPKFNQPDMIHPNPAGVALIVAGLKPQVEAMLKQP